MASFAGAGFLWACSDDSVSVSIPSPLGLFVPTSPLCGLDDPASDSLERLLRTVLGRAEFAGDAVTGGVLGC